MEISLLHCCPSVSLGWLRFSYVCLAPRGHSSWSHWHSARLCRKVQATEELLQVEHAFENAIYSFFLIFIDVLAKWLWHSAISSKSTLEHSDSKHFLFWLLLWSAFLKHIPVATVRINPEGLASAFQTSRYCFFSFTKLWSIFCFQIKKSEWRVTDCQFRCWIQLYILNLTCCIFFASRLHAMLRLATLIPYEERQLIEITFGLCFFLHVRSHKTDVSIREFSPRKTLRSQEW